AARRDWAAVATTEVREASDTSITTSALARLCLPTPGIGRRLRWQVSWLVGHRPVSAFPVPVSGFPVAFGHRLAMLQSRGRLRLGSPFGSIPSHSLLILRP